MCTTIASGTWHTSSDTRRYLKFYSKRFFQLERFSLVLDTFFIARNINVFSVYICSKVQSYKKPIFFFCYLIMNTHCYGIHLHFLLLYIHLQWSWFCPLLWYTFPNGNCIFSLGKKQFFLWRHYLLHTQTHTHTHNAYVTLLWHCKNDPTPNIVFYFVREMFESELWRSHCNRTGDRRHGFPLDYERHDPSSQK